MQMAQILMMSSRLTLLSFRDPTPSSLPYQSRACLGKPAEEARPEPALSLPKGLSKGSNLHALTCAQTLHVDAT